MDARERIAPGLFAHDPDSEDAAAREIVIRVRRAVSAARPFFDWTADQAVAASRVNVVNNSYALFERFTYLRDAHRAKAEEAEDPKDVVHVQRHKSAAGGEWETFLHPAWRLRTEARWLAMSAIDAFFAWTEHVFVHLSILSGKTRTAEEVAALAEADWTAKFKRAFDIGEQSVKSSFDALVAMRTELRNYVAHGAFGKQGEAFAFHSGAGAVPVLLPHRTGSKRFKLAHGLEFDAEAALQVIERFVSILWSGNRSPARTYIQDSHLPIVLTMVADGTYSAAMRSDEAMNSFVKELGYRFDQATNMDW